jgi:hypothetical protein
MTSFFTYFCQKSGRGATLALLTSPFRLVLLLLQTTRGQEKSGRVVVRSPHGASQNTNWFKVPSCGEFGGWLVRSRAWFLALSKWTFGAAPI